MAGIQKTDITFFLFDKIINHENRPFIDKILDHFDLQTHFLRNRQTEICYARAKRRMHVRVPQKYHQVSTLSVFHTFIQIAKILVKL